MNMPDKNMKGQGWKETLESWEPKVDAGGWEMLQQRVPSGNLFRLRQLVEGSAVKAARMLGKATFVKVAAVAAIATTLPGDLVQRATTNEYTARITSELPVTTAIDSSKSIHYTLAQKGSSDSGNALLSNNSAFNSLQVLQSDGLAEPDKNQQEPTRTSVIKKELLQREPKAEIVEPPATTRETTPRASTRAEISSRKVDNSNNRRHGNKPAINSSQLKWSSKKTVIRKNETLLAANNALPGKRDKQEIAVTAVKQDANQKHELINNAIVEQVIPTVTNSATEQLALISNPSATTVVIDSTALANIIPPTDSLNVKAKIEEPAKETSKGKNLNFYKAIATGGGIFSGSGINGGFGQVDVLFGANYGRIFGARLSASISALQGKFDGDSTMVADTGSTSHLVQSIATYRMQQLTFGIDLSQRIWGNESTSIYLFEGVRGAYRIGESPKPTATTKFFPLASARLSVAIFRKTKYGQFIIEPSIEFHNKNKGNLPNGMTSIGVAMGWCF